MVLRSFGSGTTVADFFSPIVHYNADDIRMQITLHTVEWHNCENVSYF